MRQLLKVLTLSFLIVSCGQSDTKQKELELKERELALKEKELSLKEKETVPDSAKALNQTSPKDESSSINNQLTNVFKISMPVTYINLKSILGGETKIVKEDTPDGSETYDIYQWELSDGTIISFDKFGGEGASNILIEAKGQQVIKTPLDISINQSTYNDCKAIIQNLEKGISYDNYKIWKFKKGKAWHYLIFTKDNLLKKIRLTSWDVETTG